MSAPLSHAPFLFAPATAVAAAGNPRQSVPPADTSGLFLLGGAPALRVLHAEDDQQVAGIVALYFEQQGAVNLTHVTSGRACLDALKLDHFDVVLLDLVLPDLNGLEVLGELAARGDPTPVIMVSGNGQSELAVRALRAGAVDCIDKNSPDFSRVPEIAKRAFARHRRQLRSSVPPMPIRGHRVIYLDAAASERSELVSFLYAHAPKIALTPATPATLADGGVTPETFDAIVIGAAIEPAAMLDLLRHLRSRVGTVPIIVLSADASGGTAVAAFKLGAHDYLLLGATMFTELVFSLNHALKQADTERINARLTDELAALNRSLAGQVASRTRELETEVAVRRAAEEQAGEHAARSRALSTRLLRVQEDERRNIAQELHDQVGQLLTGLRFQLEARRQETPALNEALTLTDELLRTVRELTLQLRPRTLDDLGLRPALEWQTNLFQRQTGIAVELEVSLPPARLATELETTVFRVVQEALTNVARHSGAPAAAITVTADQATLHVEVSDRGQGFDPALALAQRDSLGLAGTAERVSLAGGRFEIFSRPGEGTRLHAEFPLSFSA